MFTYPDFNKESRARGLAYPILGAQTQSRPPPDRQPHPLEAPIFLPMTAYRLAAICSGVTPLDTQARSPLYSPYQKGSSYDFEKRVAGNSPIARLGYQ
jgi:hypothetical protein